MKTRKLKAHFVRLRLRTAKEFLNIFIILSGVLTLTFFFLAQPLEITGDSMSPSFKNGEQILAEKVSVRFREVKRGDIVIFKRETNKNILIIKRVIGLPNETVRFKNSDIYIDNNILEEDYLVSNTPIVKDKFLKNDIEYKIPSDSYVVLGDNRSSSTDSRDWGFIKEEYIVGKAVLVYFPLRSFRFIN